jgi:hypothetical protein
MGNKELEIYLLQQEVVKLRQLNEAKNFTCSKIIAYKVIINNKEYKTPFRYVEGSYIKELIKAPYHYEVQLYESGNRLSIKDNDCIDLNDPNYKEFYVKAVTKVR